MTFESAATDPSIDPAKWPNLRLMAAEWWTARVNSPPCTNSIPVRLEFHPAGSRCPFRPGRQKPQAFRRTVPLDIGCGGGLCPSPWPGWDLPSPAPTPRSAISAPPKPMPPKAGSPLIIEPPPPKAWRRKGSASMSSSHGSGRACCRCGGLSLGLFRAGQAGGITVVATLNKTPQGAGPCQDRGGICAGWLPRGTHDWNRFIPPTGASREA